jgi:hypothetical protein
MGTSLAKFTHKSGSGASGIPPAMEKMPARMNMAKYPTKAAIWKRMYLRRLS